MKNTNILEHANTRMIFDTTNIHVEHNDEQNELFIAIPSTELDTKHLITFIKTLDVDEQTSNRMFDNIIEMVERETFFNALMKQRK